MVPQTRWIWLNRGILADVASPAVLARIRTRIRILSLTASNTTRVQVDIVRPARAEVTRGTLSLKLGSLRTVCAVSALSVYVCAVAWAVVALRAGRLVCRQGRTVSFGFASELLSGSCFALVAGIAWSRPLVTFSAKVTLWTLDARIL